MVIENMRRIEELKMDLSRHFKTEVERKMVSIAVKCPLVKQSTFEGLQKLWLSLNPKTTTNYSAYEDSYWRITQNSKMDIVVMVGQLGHNTRGAVHEVAPAEVHKGR